MSAELPLTAAQKQKIAMRRYRSENRAKIAAQNRIYRARRAQEDPEFLNTMREKIRLSQAKRRAENKKGDEKIPVRTYVRTRTPRPSDLSIYPYLGLTKGLALKPT